MDIGSAIQSIPGAIKALMLAASVLWTGHLLSLRLLPGAGVSTRWSACALLSLTELLGLFFPLLALGLFKIEIALFLCVTGAILAQILLDRRLLGARALGRDLSSLRELGMELPSSLRVVAAVAAVVAAMRAARGLVSPPLAADALSYHLFRSASWVQHGHDRVEPAPDAWDYYNHFPMAGDALWAWAMLPAHADTWVGAMSVSLWALCLLAAYAAARSFGAARPGALGAGLLVATLPAAMNALGACYVDNTVLLFWLFALIFLFRVLTAPTTVDLLLLFLTAAAMASVKTSMVPSFGLLVGLVFLRLYFLRKRSPVREGPGPLRFFLLLLLPLPLLWDLIGSWVDHGSPFYPFSFHLGPIALQGDTELELGLKGLIVESIPNTFIEQLDVFFGPQARIHDSDVLGFGPGPLLIIPLILLSLHKAVANRKDPWTLIVPCLLMLLVFFPILRPDLSALRGGWLRLLPRLLLVLPATLIVFASLAQGARVAWFWSLAILANLLCVLPRGWLGADLQASLELLALVVVGGSSLSLAHRARRFALTLRVGAFLLMLMVVGIAHGALRDRWRLPIYQGFYRDPPAFDMHQIDPWASRAVAVWAQLDAMEADRVAVAPSWYLFGHHWYLYPLMGRHLQHEVLYVPPSRSGEIIDLRERERFRAELDEAAWLERLRQREVGLVFVMVPPPVEARWIIAHPERFEALLMWDEETPALARVLP